MILHELSPVIATVRRIKPGKYYLLYSYNFCSLPDLITEIYLVSQILVVK